MYKEYRIYYNDGAFYGSVIFENKTRRFIQKYLLEEIKENNKNINKDYHINFKNIKRVGVWYDNFIGNLTLYRLGIIKRNNEKKSLTFENKNVIIILG